MNYELSEWVRGIIEILIHTYANIIRYFAIDTCQINKLKYSIKTQFFLSLICLNIFKFI